VHRDIKPTNVMASLEEEGSPTVKIIDLGLAKGEAESQSEPAISMLGAFVGTPEFASPEQFAGVGIDIRSDLYSLGVTLWQMLIGQAPFRGSPAEVMDQHQCAPLPLGQLEGVPQPLVVLLERLLEKDPGRRFQTPAELLKVMPTITDAIESGRRVTRQRLRKTTPANLRLGTRVPQQERDKRRFPWRDCLLQGAIYLVERRISPFWMLRGRTGVSMSLP
jgi:serine/threonine protein kinase